MGVSPEKYHHNRIHGNPLILQYEIQARDCSLPMYICIIANKDSTSLLQTPCSPKKSIELPPSTKRNTFMDTNIFAKLHYCNMCQNLEMMEHIENSRAFPQVRPISAVDSALDF